MPRPGSTPRTSSPRRSRRSARTCGAKPSSSVEPNADRRSRRFTSVVVRPTGTNRPSQSSALAPRYLLSFPARLRQADRDRLLAALDLSLAPAAPERPALALAHRALDVL